MQRSRIQLFFIFTLITFLSVFGQEKQPLIPFLNSLEKKFDVKFSYSVIDIENIKIKTPDKTDDLEGIIASLSQTTPLKFEFLDQRYITITVKKERLKICGVIKSAQDNEILAGANIEVLDTKIGTTADKKGNFYLKNLTKDAVIRISFLGFETLTLSAKAFKRRNSDCIVILLKPQTKILNQVLITKFLTTGIQQQIDGSTVLNSKKFGILPGLTEPDMLQSIQTLPGVESVNESIANINIRGGTNDQNLILWDGIKMYHSGHFFGLISAYNPYLTEKVVVSKNGTSSEFSDGVSSTVYLSTENKLEEKISGGFGANLLHADAFLKIPVGKKVTLHISGRRSFTDVLNSFTYNNYFERSFQDSELTTNQKNISDSSQDSKFFFYDYSAKLLFDLNEKHKFRLSGIGIHNQLDHTESFTNSFGASDSKTSNLFQENIGLSGLWSGKWGKRFSTEFSTFYSKYTIDAIDFRIESDQRVTQANEVLESGTKLKTNYEISNHLKLLNGYQFGELGILNATSVNNPVFETTQKNVLLSHALFSELEFKNRRTYLRAGIRANYFEKFNKILIEPRLNLKQNLFRSLAVKVAGEFKNQTASQIIDFQDDFLGVENRRWILANETDISISKSKQASLGISYSKNNWLIDIEGFFKNVNGISVANQGFQNNFQFSDTTGSYLAKGIEFIINKTTNTYSAWISYTYSKNDYEFETLNPPIFPNNVDIRHSFSAACNYDISKKLKLSLGGVWRTGTPFTKPISGNQTIEEGNRILVNYDLPNAENLDDFIRFDFSASYKFQFSEKFDASVRVGTLNILNRKNIINQYYEVDPNDTSKAIAVKNLSLGITPNVNLRVEF